MPKKGLPPFHTFSGGWTLTSIKPQHVQHQFSGSIRKLLLNAFLEHGFAFWVTRQASDHFVKALSRYSAVGSRSDFILCYEGVVSSRPQREQNRAHRPYSGGLRALRSLKEQFRCSAQGGSFYRSTFAGDRSQIENLCV